MTDLESAVAIIETVFIIWFGIALLCEHNQKDTD